MVPIISGEGTTYVDIEARIQRVLVIETQHALVVQLVGASPEIEKHTPTVSELSRHACVVSLSCRVEKGCT
jgi:hypothetical protein